jgi:hypothetical protein
VVGPSACRGFPASVVLLPAVGDRDLATMKDTITLLEQWRKCNAEGYNGSCKHDDDDLIFL